MALNEAMAGGIDQVVMGGDHTWLREWLREYLRFHDHLVQFAGEREPMRRPSRRPGRNRQDGNNADNA